MQSSINENQMFEEDVVVIDESANQTPSSDKPQEGTEPIWFKTFFTGYMEMYADAETVAKYFDDHSSWFRRCAHPMTAEPIGTTGYALTIGRFGALGYQVEPKVGLNLLPANNGVYLIQTIPVPDYTPPGYEVDFKAEQALVEVETDWQDANHTTDRHNTCPTDFAENLQVLNGKMTRVEWKLNLAVGVCIPKFILGLPRQKIQNAGDRLLAEIVKQVSRRLTAKVQEDFHGFLGEDKLKLFKKNVAQKRKVAHCEQCK